MKYKILFFGLAFGFNFFCAGQAHAATAGWFHTCAVKSDGSVLCWGNNWLGQLGDNSTTDSYLPTQVKGVDGAGYLTGINQVEAGSMSSCALKSDGTVFCWGDNAYGQLGDNSTTQRLAPVQVKGVGGVGYLTGVSQIAMGYDHTCALKSDGSVFCWGWNASGQLGDDSTNDSHTPIQVKGVGGTGNLTNIGQITLGNTHSCALKSDGSVFCWGNNSSGALGDDTNTERHTPVQTLGLNAIGHLAGISQLSAGGSHTCAIRSDGTVLCWGYNGWGQLGNSSTTDSNLPIQVMGVDGMGYLTDASQIVSGFSHTCMVKSDGSVFCWGHNAGGVLGNNSTTDSQTPVQALDMDGISNLGGVNRIVAGVYHTCAIKSDGTVFCWGSNSGGQLGNNSSTDSPIPVQVQGVMEITYYSGASQVVGGDSHTCSLKSDGTVFCWGNNFFGQLGNNSTANSPTTVQVQGVGGSGFLTGVNQVATGANHSCALKSDGTVFCWGYNVNGQLGDNSTSDSYVPVQVTGVGGTGYLTGVNQIATGTDFTCAIKTDSSLFCWGDNGWAQLGNNTYITPTLTPTQVLGVGGSGYLTGVTQVSGGWLHACAVSGGSVFCWGYDGYGQLGNNSTDGTLVPTQVLGVGGSGYLSSVTQVVTGANHVCALKSDGSVFCWGYNIAGELGDGSTSDSHVPVQVQGVGGVGYLASVSQLVAVSDHTCALKSDGSVFCWGYNGSGELGNNSFSSSATPVQVVGFNGSGYLDNTSKIGAGSAHTCVLKNDGSVFCWGGGWNGQLGNNTYIQNITPVQVVASASSGGYLNLGSFSNTYTLNYTSGSKGSISGTALQSVNQGENGTEVTAVANGGYHFVNWSDGSTQNPRTDINVSRDIRVVANFLPYNVRYVAGSHGSISGVDSQIINEGSDSTPVTAIPDSGYRFTNWSDGSTQNPRTDTNVQSDLTFTANFTPIIAGELFNAALTLNDYRNTEATGAVEIDFANALTIPTGGKIKITIPNEFTANDISDLISHITALTVDGNAATITSASLANKSITIAVGEQIASASQIVIKLDDSVINANPATLGTYTFHINTYNASDVLLDSGAIDINISGYFYSVVAYGTSVEKIDSTDYSVADSLSVTSSNSQDIDGFNGAAVDPSTNDVYVILRLLSPNGRYLARLDMSTGLATVIGKLNRNFAAITFDNSGQLYGLTGDGDSTDPSTLYSINKTTAGITLLAAYANDWTGETLAYNPNDNKLYRATQTDMFAIDPSDAENPETVYSGKSLLNNSITGLMYLRGTSFDIASYDKVYAVDSATGDGGQLGTMSDATKAIFTWLPLTGNETYTLSYAAGPDGSIAGTTPQIVNRGANGTAVTAVPDANYHFVSWSDSSTQNPRTDMSVFADKNVTANFAINTYTLTYGAGANGTISGTSPQTINSGSDGTAVTAVPDAGAHFVDWNDSSTQNPRTDTNVSSNISVTANFALNTYTLTYSAGSDGTISGTSSQTVNYGDSGTAVTAVPSTGYHFINWSDSSTQNPRTDTDVMVNKSVIANFAINTYTLNYNAGSNGTITGTSSQTVNYGASGTAVTAVPNSNYHFVNWSDSLTTANRTDANVTADASYTANFAINTHMLTYIANNNGTLSGVTSQTIDYGSSGTAVTAIPDSGYHFAVWSDGSIQNPRAEQNVINNKYLTAYFIVNVITSPEAWTQTDWSGDVSSDLANHPTNATNWTKYTSKDAEISAATDLHLQTTTGSNVQTTDTDFSTGTNSNTKVSGSDTAGMVGLLDSATQIVGGSGHSCALKTDGTVYCWGSNGYGQLGDNTTTTRFAPVQVLGVGGSGFLTGVKQIAAGDSHTCAAMSDGTAFCWGNNDNGQLGNNSTSRSYTPVEVLGVGGSGNLTGVNQLSAGYAHTCALKSDNSVFCWGYNGSGQLGDNTASERHTPIQVLGVGGAGNLTAVSQVSANNYSTCALKSDSTVFCWGYNYRGQLGDNSTTQRYAPVQVLAVNGWDQLTGVRQISVGAYSTCAVKTDGAVLCWGYNNYGQLGDNTITQRLFPVQVLGVGGSGNLTGASQVVTGTYHTCALKSDNTVFCWGSNSGQLGDNTNTERHTPVQVLGVGGAGNLTGVSQITAGSGHTCAIQSDGSALCWGSNGSGQLGDNSSTTRLTPVQVVSVANLSSVSQVAIGYNHSCALKSDGTVFCWGSNGYGQLGDNTTTQRNSPVQVLGVGGSGYLSNVSQIAAGQYHTCAVKSDNTVFCWGDNTNGKLGDNTTTERHAPVQVVGVGGSGNLTSVNQIAAGDYHTCALKTDNTVFCWGYNSSGQLGDNTYAQKTAPVQVTGVGGVGTLAGVSQITAGNSHTCAVKTDNTAFCWGNGGSGRLGDNAMTTRSAPVQVKGVGGVGTLASVSQITAGNSHTCAVKTDGTAFCWGYNYNGRLGDNTTTARNAPVQVKGVGGSGNLTGVSNIMAGYAHTCAVKSDNTTFCWGYNSNGQLGDNTYSQRLTPVQVLGVGGSGNLIGVSKVGAGYEHTCSLKTDNTVFCWGYNYYGQLGDMSTSDRYTPVQAKYLNGYFNLGAAAYSSSGTFTSIVNPGQKFSPTTISFSKSTPANTTLTVDVRSGNTATPDGTWTSWQTNVSNGADLSALGSSSYFQYRANLATTDTAVTPTLNDITLNYQYYPASETLQSSSYNTSFPMAVLGKLHWTETLPAGTDINFQIRTSPDNTNWTPWCGPDDGVPNSCNSLSYFTDSTGGELIDDTQRNKTEDQYVQYKAFLISDGGSTPTLYDTILEFQDDTRTLVYNAGANGSLTGTALQEINYAGNGTTVTAVPDSGYHFVNWSDGSTQNPRTDTNVTSNIIVTANFADVYTMTYTAGAHGMISGANPQAVSFGGNGTAVTAVPVTGYHFVNWSDGSTQNPRTDLNVQNELPVTANFAINTYTLTYAAGSGGTVSGTSPQTVDYGGSGSVILAVPDPGYRFMGWNDNILSASRTDSNIAANKSVTANFSSNTYALNYTAGANGTLTGETSQTVNYAASGSPVTAVADTDYHFSIWSDGVTVNPRTDTSSAANKSFTAFFVSNSVAASEAWTQTDWTSGASSDAATYPANALDWTKYSSKDDPILATTDLSLEANVNSNTLTTDTDFSAGDAFKFKTEDGIYTNGYGKDGGHFQTEVTGTGQAAAVKLLGDFVSQVVTGNTHSCALKTDGYVYCWGDNSKYQLGTGSNSQSLTPVRVAGVADARQIAAGGDQTCALKSDGTVYCWGGNSVSVSYDQTPHWGPPYTDTKTYVAGPHGHLDGETVQILSESIPNGTPVTAVPDTGYHFVAWNDGSTDNPRQDFYNTFHQTFTANFAINNPTQVASLSGVSQIAVAKDHACALKSDSTLFCWGANGSGQLGNGSTVDSLIPTQVVGVGGVDYFTGVRQISTGPADTCAIKADNTLFCWGSQGNGQLGIGIDYYYAPHPTPEQVLGVNYAGYLTGVSKVSTGNVYTCAIKIDGTVFCWGAADGNYDVSFVPEPMVDMNGATEISVGDPWNGTGDRGVCTLKADSTVFCWQYAWDYHYVPDELYGHFEGPGSYLTDPVQVAGVGGNGFLTNVSQVAVGGTQKCTRQSDSSVLCWGDNTYGQLGDNSVTSSVNPVQVIIMGDENNYFYASQISTGSAHSCAINTADNTASCWGSGEYGQLGNGASPYDSVTPVQVSNLTDLAQVSAGTDHSCALKSDGTVYCWGHDDHGQLGDGTYVGHYNEIASEPVQVLDVGGNPYQGQYLTGVSQVVAGNGSSCALKLDGTVLCWGNDDKGQAGNGSVTTPPIGLESPVQVSGLSGVSQIAMGGEHVCALKFDGSVFCWGDNTNGQLGDNTTTQRLTPVRVLGPDGSGHLTGVSQIIGGKSHTCALRYDGMVLCWGANDDGQLGNISTDQSLTPVQVKDTDGIGYLSGIKQIGGGDKHTCALRSDGAVFCWGDDYYKQLGYGSRFVFVNHAPVQVVGVGDSGNLTDISQLSVGANHSCVIKSDGTVFCWGRNDSGQLGSSTNGASSSAPVKVTIFKDNVPADEKFIPFKLGTVGYFSSGTFLSPTMYAGADSFPNRVTFTKSNQPGSIMSIDFRSGYTDNPWRTSTQWTEWQTNITSGSPISRPGSAPYFQYRVNLLTTNTASTPALNDITFSSISYPTTPQALESSSYNTNDPAAIISKIHWPEDMPSGTDIKFQLRTSPDNATWTSWCGPDNSIADSCDSDSYFTDPAGNETIDDTQSDGINDQYVQYKVLLSSDGTDTPVLPEATLEFQGNNSGPIAHTLTYLTDSNGTISGDNPQTVDDGASGTEVLPVPNLGYHFVSWSDNYPTAARTDVNVTADITVTANFTIDTHTVTFDKNTGDTEANPNSITANYDTVIDPLPTSPTKANYHFIDWNTSADGSGTTFSNTTHVTSNLMVYAQWSSNSLTLTYTADTNGTITGITPQTVNYGSDGSPVTAVPNSGYHFVNWSDNSTDNPRKDTDVQNDINVTANFSIDIVGSGQLNISADVESMLTFSCGPAINLGTIIPGTPNTGSVTCTTTTNNADGYSISIKKDKAITLDDGNGTDITDKPAWNNSTPNSDIWSGTGLGFRVNQTGTTANYSETWWGSDDSTNNAKFAGFPTAYQSIMTNNTYSTASADTIISTKLNVPATQKTGDYAGTVTVQVVVNP